MCSCLEHWKLMKCGRYKVSSKGRITSIGFGEMRPHKNKKGYLLQPLVLVKGGRPRTFKVHRLVATAFIPNPINLDTVDHKDEDKSNNCVCVILVGCHKQVMQ